MILFRKSAISDCKLWYIPRPKPTDTYLLVRSFRSEDIDWQIIERSVTRLWEVHPGNEADIRDIFKALFTAKEIKKDRIF